MRIRKNNISSLRADCTLFPTLRTVFGTEEQINEERRGRAERREGKKEMNEAPAPCLAHRGSRVSVHLQLIYQVLACMES